MRHLCILLTCTLALWPALSPAEEPSAGKGTLRLFTLPGNAEIFINDQRKGLSPALPEETFSIGLGEGEYRVRAAKAGFGTVERTVFIGADTEQTLRLSLVPEISMVPIAGGCFQMGSPEGEPERDPDEGPQHEVCVKPFEIGAYEVTFDDWDACVADGGCRPVTDDHGWGRGRQPVINVSFEDVQAYLVWLNRATGSGYRLPTEAEWEYAARAGTTTPFSTGECITTEQANYDGTFAYGDCPTPGNVDVHRAKPVGSYPPNPWGLYDMNGNLVEFVADCWNEGYKGAPTDGSAWLEGNCGRRVMRGGSWYGFAGFMRSAYRCRVGLAFGHRTIGFRLARTPEA